MIRVHPNGASRALAGPSCGFKQVEPASLIWPHLVGGWSLGAWGQARPRPACKPHLFCLEANPRALPTCKGRGSTIKPAPDHTVLGFGRSHMNEPADNRPQARSWVPPSCSCPTPRSSSFGWLCSRIPKASETMPPVRETHRGREGQHSSF